MKPEAKQKPKNPNLPDESDDSEPDSDEAPVVDEANPDQPPPRARRKKEKEKARQELFNLRMAGCLAGMVYVALTAASFIWSKVLAASHFSRGNEIYVAFEALLILPSFPYFMGVWFCVPDLVVPLFIASFYNVLIKVSYILAVYNTQYFEDPEVAEDVFYFGDMDSATIMTFWVVCIICSCVVFSIAFKLWRGLVNYEEDDQDKYKSYEFQRYETTRV